MREFRIKSNQILRDLKNGVKPIVHLFAVYEKGYDSRKNKFES